MLGLDNQLLMGLVVGVFLGYYLGNKEFRTKINDMIFKKKAKTDVPPTVHTTSTDTKKGAERDD